MYLKLPSAILFCIITMIHVGLAQTKTWNFDDELCIYTGYYDSKKYSEKQLEETHQLFSSSHYVPSHGTFDELTGRYDSVICAIENLDVVSVSYFQELKKDVLRYLQETYALKKVEKKAKEESGALIDAVAEGTEAREYAIALHAGGGDLLLAYERLVKQQMEDNSIPEYLWNNYEYTMSRPDRLERAFDYVLVYGWWNSANQLVNHLTYDGSQMEEFQKLFIKVETVDCDEP